MVKLKGALVQKPKSLSKLKRKAGPKIKSEEVVSSVRESPKDTVVISKKKNVMPSKYITEKLVTSCLDALYVLENKFNKGTRLFDNNTMIFAEIRCIKIPKVLGNVRFVLPHPLITADQEANMVIADEKKNSDYFQDIVDQTPIKTVIPLRELRKSYDQFELQRRLRTQQDFLLIDTRVYNHAAHVLGNRFKNKHNLFIPVRFNKNNIKDCIDVGLRTTMLKISDGETSTVCVGNTAMNKDNVRENILAMVKQLNRYPGGEINIRSINIKLPKSISLPIYFTLRSSNSILVPKVAHTKPKRCQDIMGDLSTIPGTTVRVCPDGTIKVYREKKRNNEDEEEIELEEEVDGEEEDDGEEDEEIED